MDSAQRLTASKVKTLVEYPFDNFGCFVLNALRHLRLKHRQTHHFYLSIWCVLNALRHLRLKHSENVAKELDNIGAQRLTASKVKTHTQLHEFRINRNVLNALRHLRLKHMTILRDKERFVSAQRLTASKVKTLFIISISIFKNR